MRIVLGLPKIFWYTILYKLCIIKKEENENIANNFMKTFFSDTNQINKLVDEFWEINEKNFALECLITLRRMI